MCGRQNPRSHSRRRPDRLGWTHPDQHANPKPTADNSTHSPTGITHTSGASGTLREDGMSEIEALRREVASLRDEVARLRAAPAHTSLSPYYHCQPISPTVVRPYYPGGPIPSYA